MEPNLGTALLFIFLWFGLIVMAGARPLHIGIIVLVAVLAAPGGWMLMRDYQRARIETFFATVVNPENDPFGEGYNILQARISIGSGGMFGQGWLQGTQTQLDYLRVKQSDFIFSVLAEEMGFIGAMVLFALFIILLFRVMRVVDKAPDGFARVVAFGVGWVVLFQAFVNLGANLTVLPGDGGAVAAGELRRQLDADVPDVVRHPPEHPDPRSRSGSRYHSAEPCTGACGIDRYSGGVTHFDSRGQAASGRRERSRARRASMASPPASDQRMPERFMRRWTT